MKAKLGNELIGMLYQMFQLYWQELGSQSANKYLGKTYKQLQELLGFPGSAENPLQIESDQSRYDSMDETSDESSNESSDESADEPSYESSDEE